MIRTILIDDEAINIDMLQNRLAKYCPQVEVVETAVSVQEGLEKIILHKPDLIFLDIEIHDQTGFDLLNALQDETLNVILCTAYDKYALEGYKYNILGYLLKPIDIVELVNFVKKAEKNINKIAEQKVKRNNNGYLKIPYRDCIEFVKTTEIIHLNAKGGYTEIVCATNQYLSSNSLGEIEKMLPSEVFLRVHKSYIININYVVKLLKIDNGFLKMTNQSEIPVSTNVKKELGEIFGF